MKKYRVMGSVSVNVDVDIDDILYELSRSEKRELFDTLKEDLGVEDMVNGDEVIVGTTTEQELFDICNKIYENRNSLTNEDKVFLIKLSKKGWYEKVV
jgi:UDP-glucose 6-dehydrogenase